MDIHRCRFVPYPASPINAISFSHPTATKQNKRLVRLAIGRANGDIEIWNPLSGRWYQETTIHGGRDTSVDGLVWSVGEDETLVDGTFIPGRVRLFSIGYTTSVTEWDLERGRAKRHASGQHGEIWCLGLQPPAPSQANGLVNGVTTGTALPRKLVAGTVDGSLVLYSIQDDDLQFEKVLVRTPKGNVKMVSIAFQSRNVVIVGCSDSSVRAYDLKRGQLLRKMTLGADLSGGSKNIIVWAVKCLKNGDIVTGDSTGQVCIWDGKTYTQAQRIQSHKQDVLSLATSADGSMIISGGMDKRTVVYRPAAHDKSRWAKAWHRRYHQHDVKAIASFEHQNMSVIVSGGPDATPIVAPLRRAGAEQHRKLSHLPQSVPVQSAPGARVLISWWDREVHVWRLRKPMSELVETEEDVESNKKLLGRILVKGDSNITSASISPDGSKLVVATSTVIKFFYLDIPEIVSSEPMRIRTIQTPSSLADSGATKVQISPDGHWLCTIRDGSHVVMFRFEADDDAQAKSFNIQPTAFQLKRVSRPTSKQALLGGLGNYDRTIKHVAFTKDAKMLAVSDLAGYIDTWVLKESGPTTNGHKDDNGTTDDAVSDSSDSDDGSADEDTNAIHSGPTWTRNPNGALIPRLGKSPLTVLSFSDDIQGVDSCEDYTLLAVDAASHFYTFHALQGSITDWSKRNTISRLPSEVRLIRDLVKGVIWQGTRLWVYGISFLYLLDLASDYSNGETAAGPEDKDKRKRKRGVDTGAGSKMGSHSFGATSVQVASKQDEKSGEWADVEMADVPGPETQQGENDGSDDDDDDDENESVGSDDGEAKGKELQKMREEGAARRVTTSPKWWHTYKYRPILGIVPLALPQEGRLVNGVADGNKRITPTWLMGNYILRWLSLSGHFGMLIYH